MSGRITISAGNSWIAAGWVFRNIVADVARDLQATDPASARLFAEAEQPGVLAAIDLGTLSGREVRTVLAAVRRARDQVAAAGPASFAMPDFHAGFVAQVDRLIGMIESDSRMRSS